MLRNVAGQTIGAEMIDRNTGAPFTGPVHVYITGDGGVQTIGIIGGGLCAHEGRGYHTYKPSQPETNFHFIGFTFDGGPDCITQSVQVTTITEAQAAALATATVTTIIGDGPTRTELLNQLAHRLNKTPPPLMDSATETRLASYLNQRHRRILTMPGLARLRDATVSFTSVDALAHYGLPNITKVSRIFEQTNERTLWEMSLQDYRLLEPRPMTGTPEAYVWRGRQAVAYQPSAPTALWLVSSANDTSVVYIEGALASGALRSVTVTLQGTSPVNIAATVADWVRVDKFFLAVPCSGVVSLAAESGGAPLASIQAGATSTIYTGLTLYPTPSAAIVYFVDVTRPITDMVKGNDQALIPPDYADMLVLGALADEYQHLSDQRWSAAVAEYKERERDFKYWLAETAIGQPLGLTSHTQRPSQLGPWFPAGS